MTRLLAAVAAVVVGVLPVSLGAQGYTVIAEWDPNPATENVTQYRVQVGASLYYVPAESCTTVCAQPISVSEGSHTLSVAAENTFGWGPTSSLTFTLSVPGNSQNLRIRIP